MSVGELRPRCTTWTEARNAGGASRLATARWATRRNRPAHRCHVSVSHLHRGTSLTASPGPPGRRATDAGDRGLPAHLRAAGHRGVHRDAYDHGCRAGSPDALTGPSGGGLASRFCPAGTRSRVPRRRVATLPGSRKVSVPEDDVLDRVRPRTERGSSGRTGPDRSIPAITVPRDKFRRSWLIPPATTARVNNLHGNHARTRGRPQTPIPIRTGRPGRSGPGRPRASTRAIGAPARRSSRPGP